jgi:hypothetical protein
MMYDQASVLSMAQFPMEESCSVHQDTQEAVCPPGMTFEGAHVLPECLFVGHPF